MQAHIHTHCRLAIKKEGDPAIYNNMDGPKRYHAK